MAEAMVAENTNVVGTVRPNRVGMPKDLVQKSMTQSEFDIRRKNQILAVKWRDKKDVHMHTTKHMPDMQRVTSQAGNAKDKPVCVVEYIANMAGWISLIK